MITVRPIDNCNAERAQKKSVEYLQVRCTDLVLKYFFHTEAGNISNLFLNSDQK